MTTRAVCLDGSRRGVDAAMGRMRDEGESADAMQIEIV